MQIGELARRTGLPVKTIRYYSDIGLVPEADRTHAGFRSYDTDALVRLEFVRTLRELGLDIATIRRVLDQGAELGQVAAAHADALGAQIRVLRLQRAALRALARRPADPGELDRVHRIAQATADERRRILDDFLDSIFTGTPVDPAFAQRIRSIRADLPEDPTDAQVDAWIELADLLRDEDFRQRLRALSQRSFGGDRGSAHPTGADATRVAALVTAEAGAAHTAGVDPAGEAAKALLAKLVGEFAAAAGRADDTGYRRELLDQVELAYDPRAERYWQLLAVINGWPPVPTTMPAWGWFVAALRAGL